MRACGACRFSGDESGLFCLRANAKMGRYSAGFLPSARGHVPQACLEGDDMRTFDYRNLPKDLFHRAAGDLNVRVYEDRGKLAQLESFHP